MLSTALSGQPKRTERHFCRQDHAGLKAKILIGSLVKV